MIFRVVFCDRIPFELIIHFFFFPGNTGLAERKWPALSEYCKFLRRRRRGLPDRLWAGKDKSVHCLKSTPHSFTPGYREWFPYTGIHIEQTHADRLSLTFLNDKSEPGRAWHSECVPCVWWVGHHLRKRRAAKVPASAG